MASSVSRAIIVVLLLLAFTLIIPIGPTLQATEDAHRFTFEVPVIAGPSALPYTGVPSFDVLPMNVEGTGYTVEVNFSFELLNAAESEACAGASVQLRKMNIAGFRTVTSGMTDAEGTIAFHNVSDGTYLVRIETDDDRWVRVVDGDKVLGSNYYWNTQQFTVDGDVQFSYSITDETRGAWAIYNDLRDGGEWLWEQTGWQRSQVTVSWPDGDWPHSHGDDIHIPSDEYMANAVWRRDISMHEYGHCVHYELRGGNFPEGDGPDPHYIDSESSPGFAFTEGWAQFFERAVDDDPERSDGTSLESTIFADGLFGHGDVGDMDGAIVEGAVANLLWDIYDGVDPTDRPAGNVRGDHVDRQFTVLWDIMYQMMPESIEDIKRAWPERDINIQAVFHNARIPMELDPPTNPNSFQSSHQIDQGSLDSTISLILIGATDDGSGVLGYSILIDESPDSLPDRVMDRTGNAFTTGALSPGTYYIHIRTVDQDGNWAEDAFTIGPFIILPGAVPDNEPLFPEGDTAQALLGLIIVLVVVGLMLLLVVSQEKRSRPPVPPINNAPASKNCPYCGRPDLGGEHCSYCGGRLR